MNIINSKKEPEQRIEPSKCERIVDLIQKSQNKMRQYAMKHLLASNISSKNVRVCARSSVSQRDIQRVLTLYCKLTNLYEKLRPAFMHRALILSLGLVYYLRLNTEYRREYEQFLDNNTLGTLDEKPFSRAFSEELDWFTEEIEIPDGIARTRALKENLFSIISCIITGIPLIIVGAPGSSKTLSFSLVVDNLKGKDSKSPTYRNIELFPSLDPHFYQCSRRTTSKEIADTFDRATKRQYSLAPFPVQCVVFMDEAGLPEERQESLKVLHYYLDRQEVSFVAITNRILDAAKSNRAISLFRPTSSQKDLETLAKGCFWQNRGVAPIEVQHKLKVVVNLSDAYHRITDPDISVITNPEFFGLRDFIHFVNYLRRHCSDIIHPQKVMEALERNFNGTDEFSTICDQFLTKVWLWHLLSSHLSTQCKQLLCLISLFVYIHHFQVGSSLKDVTCRNPLDILKDSLAEHPQDSYAINEVRYKLIIDPSEDDSTLRLLFQFGVLDRKNSRIYICSDFPGSSDLQKVSYNLSICMQWCSQAKVHWGTCPSNLCLCPSNCLQKPRPQASCWVRDLGSPTLGWSFKVRDSLPITIVSTTHFACDDTVLPGFHCLFITHPQWKAWERGYY